MGIKPSAWEGLMPCSAAAAPLCLVKVVYKDQRDKPWTTELKRPSDVSSVSLKHKESKHANTEYSLYKSQCCNGSGVWSLVYHTTKIHSREGENYIYHPRVFKAPLTCSFHINSASNDCSELFSLFLAPSSVFYGTFSVWSKECPYGSVDRKQISDTPNTNNTLNMF